MSAGVRGRPPRRFEDIPQLRSDPYAPDALDPMRAEYVMGLWHEQDDRLRKRDRQVEENIRMLLGQQWIAWSELKGRFVDIAEHMDDDEVRWRHMPVLNRLFLWFILTHARMTENPPVIAWQPGPDRIDSQLAEVMDPLFKYVWRDVGMLEVIDRLTSWLIPSGRAHLKTRIDPTKGDPIEAIGPAILELLNGTGGQILGPDGQPIRREIPDAPLDEDGNVKGRLFEDEDGIETFEYEDPHVFLEGGLEVDVLTCLEVRGQWGEHIPWHKKAYHIQRSLLTPIEAFEAFGQELEPDVRGEQAEDVGILWRLLHGEGLFGAAEGRRGVNQEQGSTGREFVTIYEFWHKPSRFPGMMKKQGEPGGRKLIVTGAGEVIEDGTRPAPFKYTSPIRCFDFQNLPGRPQGTSTQEMLNGPIRTRNRLHAQGIQHATMVANPTKVIDRDSGIKQGDLTNLPGEEVLASRNGSAAPIIEYVSPGRLGPEVYESADRLAEEVDQLGSIQGAQGGTPTADASGELVKELRFNSDRPIAAPMRRMVLEFARWGEDVKVMLPLVWDQEKTLQIVGDDGIARALTVWPELFEEGTINAVPEIESMLPEGRGERQNRVFKFWQSGVWGDPQSPAAINQFLDLARFPHMSRATRPGGPDRSMASQNVGRLLQGTPAVEIPILEVYDHQIHLHVLVQFMKSPEYLKTPPPVMEQIELYRQRLMSAQAMAAQNAARRELMANAPIMQATADAEAEIQGSAEATRAAVTPPPERAQETLSPQEVA